MSLFSAQNVIRYTLGFFRESGKLLKSLCITMVIDRRTIARKIIIIKPLCYSIITIKPLCYRIIIIKPLCYRINIIKPLCYRINIIKPLCYRIIITIMLLLLMRKIFQVLSLFPSYLNMIPHWLCLLLIYIFFCKKKSLITVMNFSSFTEKQNLISNTVSNRKTKLMIIKIKYTQKHKKIAQ